MEKVQDMNPRDFFKALIAARGYEPDVERLPGAFVHGLVVKKTLELRQVLFELRGLPSQDQASFIKSLALYEQTVGGIGSTTLLLYAFPLVNDPNHELFHWVVDHSVSLDYYRRNTKLFPYYGRCLKLFPGEIARREKLERDRQRAAEKLARERQEKEAKRRRLQQDYFRSLEALPFEKCVYAIVKGNDPYCNWREWIVWKSEWSRSVDEDVTALGAESTQRLIDLCEGNLVVNFSDVLPKLYDRRHQLRHEAMDQIRSKYASMSPKDQLTELVVATSTPIAHFPVELANVVSDDWLGTLPERQRADFLAQISICRLRVWVNARQRLSLHVK